MNMPVRVEGGAPPIALNLNESELLDVLRSSLYPGAKDESIKLVLGWCRASGKDPMKRPVHIVPMSVKKVGSRDQYEWRDVLMPGIGDYRTDAARTGAYAGIDEAKFGPDKTLMLGDMEFTFPEWCEVTVYRIVGGMKCAFSSGKVRWLETYATAGKDNKAPNAMWKKRSYGQIEKCAEAMALRRAFPEVGAQPTSDEMVGRVIEDPTVIEGEMVGKSTIEMPQSTAQPMQQPDASNAPAKTEAPKNTNPVGEGQLRVLRAKLKGKNKTEQDLCEHFKIAEISLLTMDKVNDAMKFVDA